MAGGGGVFVEVGMMVVEGRQKPVESAPKGAKSGPHCPQIPTASGSTPRLAASSPSLSPSSASNSEQAARIAAVRRHMSLLNENCVAMCVDVFLCSDCSCGQARASSVCSVPSPSDLLLEQWTISFLHNKPANMREVDSKGLLQAVKSQLHFSQLSAWHSLGKNVGPVCCRLSHPNTAVVPPFSKPPITHHFPVAPDSSRSLFLKVSLESLPRLDTLPTVTCPVHSNMSPLASTVASFKTVFAELGQCLLDPPSRMPPPLKQGFLAWKEKKNSITSSSLSGHVKSLKLRRNPDNPSLGMVDDRMQCGCDHIGKHHCEEDLENENNRSLLIIDGCGKVGAKSSSTPQKNFDLNTNNTCEQRESKNVGSRLLNSVNSSLNPLKRKRHQINHNTKKQLTLSPIDRKKRNDSNEQLIEKFNRLGIHDVTNEIQTNKTSCVENKVPSPCPVPPSSPSNQRKSLWTDSSSDDTECESPVSKAKVIPLGKPLANPFRLGTTQLLGSFEECLLKGLLKACTVVEGFTADLGASGSFCPKHLTLPVTTSFFPPQGLSTPIVARIRLLKKGYNVPRSGTIQVTVFNTLGTVVKMFVVPYDLTDMPVNCQTFVRQRTVSADSNKNLRYLIHLRFGSSKSGRVFLESEIKMIICRQYDMDATLGVNTESNSQLQSSIIIPSNPKFSQRK